MTSHSLSLSGLRLVKEKSRYNVNKKIDKTTIKFWTNSHERKKGWNYGCTKEKNISKVYFDRGGYKYHGRVKVFAETLRKNGLKF